jgi:hypothetical protein
MDPQDFDTEEFVETIDSAVKIIIVLFNQNETMGDVLHSIQTSMRLLGKEKN